MLHIPDDLHIDVIVVLVFIVPGEGNLVTVRGEGRRSFRSGQTGKRHGFEWLRLPVRKRLEYGDYCKNERGRHDAGCDDNRRQVQLLGRQLLRTPSSSQVW